VTRGEGKQEVDGGGLHGGGRGELHQRQEEAEQRRQRCRRGSEEEGGEKVQGLMWKFEKIQGLPCKVKFPVDLKL
jgi:hypothetical protein